MSHSRPESDVALLTLDDLQVEDQRVLLRVDLSVPLEPGRAGATLELLEGRELPGLQALLRTAAVR